MNLTFITSLTCITRFLLFQEKINCHLTFLALLTPHYQSYLFSSAIYQATTLIPPWSHRQIFWVVTFQLFSLVLFNSLEILLWKRIEIKLTEPSRFIKLKWSPKSHHSDKVYFCGMNYLDRAVGGRDALSLIKLCLKMDEGLRRHQQD